MFLFRARNSWRLPADGKNAVQRKPLT